MQTEAFNMQTLSLGGPGRARRCKSPGVVLGNQEAGMCCVAPVACVLDENTISLFVLCHCLKQNLGCWICWHFPDSCRVPFVRKGEGEREKKGVMTRWWCALKVQQRQFCSYSLRLFSYASVQSYEEKEMLPLTLKIIHCNLEHFVRKRGKYSNYIMDRMLWNG